MFYGLIWLLWTLNCRAPVISRVNLWNFQTHAKTKNWGNKIFVADSNAGYSFWDWLRNFLHKPTWIVLSVHKLNNWVNSGKFMDNCWTSCQVMTNMKTIYNHLIIINLYICNLQRSWQSCKPFRATNFGNCLSILFFYI